jgi:hypothetical protein
VTNPELAPEAIAAMFRAARPPFIGRIADYAFLLDVRVWTMPRRSRYRFQIHGRKLRGRHDAGSGGLR